MLTGTPPMGVSIQLLAGVVGFVVFLRCSVLFGVRGRTGRVLAALTSCPCSPVELRKGVLFPALPLSAPRGHPSQITMNLGDGRKCVARPKKLAERHSRTLAGPS